MQNLVNNHGITKTGTKTNVLSKALCEKIREKLKLTKKQLPDKFIKKITDIGNKEIAQWVIDNAEGTFVPYGKNMGTLAVSKQLLRAFAEDKEEKLEKIKSLSVSDLHRKQLLKIHNVNIGDKIDLSDYTKLKEKIPKFNLSTFYYHYMLIWFNKHNCKIRKASIYRLRPLRYIMRAIYENVIKNNKLYFEYPLDYFHVRPIKEKKTKNNKYDKSKLQSKQCL